MLNPSISPDRFRLILFNSMQKAPLTLSPIDYRFILMPIGYTICRDIKSWLAHPRHTPIMFVVFTCRQPSLSALINLVHEEVECFL